MFGAMDLGVTDHSKRAGGEQAAQIAIRAGDRDRSEEWADLDEAIWNTNQWS